MRSSVRGWLVVAAAAVAVATPAAVAGAQQGPGCPDGFTAVRAADVVAASQGRFVPVVVGADHNGDIYGLPPAQAAAVVAMFAGAADDVCVSVPRKEIVFLDEHGIAGAPQPVEGLPGFVVAEDGTARSASDLRDGDDLAAREREGDDPRIPSHPGPRDDDDVWGTAPVDDEEGRRAAQPPHRPGQPTSPGLPGSGGDPGDSSAQTRPPSDGGTVGLPDWRETNRPSATFTIQDRLRVVYTDADGDETVTLFLCPQHPHTCSSAIDVGRYVSNERAAGGICGEAFYGPERLLVSGSIDGTDFSFPLNRSNSCEEQMWGKFADVFHEEDPPRPE